MLFITFYIYMPEIIDGILGCKFTTTMLCGKLKWTAHVLNSYVHLFHVTVVVLYIHNHEFQLSL